MILQNGFRDYSVCRYHGAGVLNNAYPAGLVANFARTGAARNLTVGEGITSKYVGLPNGHLAHSSWQLPQKAGAMSSRNEAVITFAAAGNAAQGMNISGNADIVFSAAGSAAAIASAIGSASFAFTAAGTAVAPVNLEGAASFSFSATGSLSAPANISGSTTIVFTGAMVTGAIGHMVAVPIDTSLTAASIAASVWAELLESGYSAGDLQRLIAAASAGKVSGASGTTITIRDVSDTKDRIVADVDASGNRTAIVVNASE